MFGHFSYLIATFILTIPVIFIEWVFYYHLLKKNILPIVITAIFGLIIVSFSEPLGIYLQAWRYGEQTTLPAFLLGTKLESYLYVVLGSFSISSLTTIYAHYQDKKIKNIFMQGIIDLIELKYFLWKKQ